MTVLTNIRQWWLPIVAGGLSIAILGAYMLIIPTVGKVSSQARLGAAARMRQCKTLPIATKVYADAKKRGVISASELADFKSTSLPPGCKSSQP